VGRPADDALLRDFESRLAGSSDVDAAELLAALVGRMRVGAVATLMERLPPAYALDYASHPIRLLVSSTQIGQRLISVEKEPFTVEWIEQSIGDDDVFYDIGANVGAYSLIAAKATSSRARVFSFEPWPASFLDLSRNVALNGCSGSITPLPLALWSANELLTFASSASVAGAAQHRVAPLIGTPEEGSEAIIGIRLDDLVEWFGLPVPTHAKIDTDGYEVDVLVGAERTLVLDEWQSIIIELDRDDTRRNNQIRTILTDAGFGVQRQHTRLPSPAFPDPDSRPDVYWTFSRDAPRHKRASLTRNVSRPGRARATPIRAAQRRAIAATLAVMTVLFLLLVFLPEELGDRPYDVFGLKF
jgi:FkbM family methyltransferase